MKESTGATKTDKPTKSKLKRFVTRAFSIFASCYIITNGVSITQRIVNRNENTIYNAIVKDFANLLKDNGYTSSRDVFNNYCYALYNGYLSYNHELSYTANRYVNIGNPGLSVILGNGVCLNFSDMLNDIYRELGYDSHTLMCYINDGASAYNILNVTPNIEDKPDANTQDDVQNTIQDNSKFKEFKELIASSLAEGVILVTGNHAVTTVYEDNELKIYDPTNLLYLYKDDFNHFNIINGTGSFTIKYYSSAAFYPTSIEILSQQSSEELSNEVLQQTANFINDNKLEEFYYQEQDKYASIAYSIGDFEELESYPEGNKIERFIARNSAFEATIIFLILKHIITDLLKYTYKKNIKKLTLKKNNNSTSQENIA